MTNYGSGFSYQQLESSASVVRTVSVPKGKAMEFLPTNHVSSANEVVHVSVVVDFLPCTMTNTTEAEVPKLFGVSIGLKRCRTECEAESKVE